MKLRNCWIFNFLLQNDLKRTIAVQRQDSPVGKLTIACNKNIKLKSKWKLNEQQLQEIYLNISAFRK